ncbi:hypothetical protein [Mycobacterium sp.]|uniref:hypothetical protein n=1 Tax=Mycobacterium sp. TaxID=1785 RepID=UPI003C7745AC
MYSATSFLSSVVILSIVRAGLPRGGKPLSTLLYDSAHRKNDRYETVIGIPVRAGPQDKTMTARTANNANAISPARNAAML